MSKPEITSTGVKVQEFTDVFNELIEGYQNIYGQDINLDQDSPDGQRVGITAKLSYDLQSFGQYIYSNLDPDFSTGQFQNVLIKFNGISRRPATRSQKDIIITTNTDLTLPADFTLKDDLDQVWVITEEKSLKHGDNTVTFFAKEFGAIASPSTAIFTPQLIVDGVLCISSTTTAEVGQNEESDEELRLRRNKTFENAAYSTVGGLLAKLVELPNITDAAVYENDKNTFDEERNMPPHSIWCIVQGGSVSDIIECIAKNKTAGTYVKGEITGNSTQLITRQDGTSFPIIYTSRFDRPKTIPLHIKVTLKRKVSTYAIDVEQIKLALVTKTFYINSAISASELYGDIYSVNGNFTAYDLQISFDGINYTDKSLTSGYDEYFMINTNNIAINEVI